MDPPTLDWRTVAALDGLLENLRAHRDELRSPGVLQPGIFGSVARRGDRPGSDVDVLVELDEETFDRYMDVKIYLEDLLGKRVDLVLRDCIRPEPKGRILGELIDAA